ncbi:asparaginase [Natrialbaceae archaeon A-arb3/5]
MERIRIVSTGGTIAATGDSTDEAGKTPSVSAEDLVESVPELEEYARIEVESVCQRSGFQIDVENATDTVEAIERADDDGVDGVVVTHGTDTMAESAYHVGLVAETDLPVVFTGAQRPFDQLGTDGPSNLVLAVRAAAHEAFREAGGSYLAFNDEIHAARWVVKSHTSKLETFRSPEVGPIAQRTPDGLRFLRESGCYVAPVSGARIDSDVRVDIVMNALGADGRQVERALEDGVDGIVLAGTGLGNATGDLGSALESAVNKGVPVVLTSRSYAGTTAGLYGGPGGGRTLLDAGAVSGGDLPAWKARLRVAVALSANGDGDAKTPIDRVASAFEGIESVD